MGQSISYSIGKLSVESNSGLAALDYPLDRTTCDVVCNILNEIQEPIIAVWVIARPIQGVAKYEHWSVIVQGSASLIKLDFYEKNGKGSFRIKTSSLEAEFEQFFIYRYNNQPAQTYRIVVSITPSTLIGPSYLKCVDRNETAKLSKNYKGIQRKIKEMVPEQANYGKKQICDICGFLDMWTRFSERNSIKDKPYNAILYNCQKFAFELFKWIVNDNYPDKIEYAAKQMQGPADVKAYKKEYATNE